MAEIIVFLFLIQFIIMLLVIMIVRYYRFRPHESSDTESYIPHEDITGAEKLSRAVQLKTISHMDGTQTDWEEFLEFHRLLEEMFPLVHQYCERTVINEYSLVYHWKPEAQPEQGPMLITAHMDVVPVEDGTQKDWKQDPFSGRIEDNMVWGRGTLDVKVHLIAAMEAMERLIREGVTPKRDIYLAFGHDEEINGEEGARKIAAYFLQQEIHFDFVLDEGGCAATHLLEGIDRPIALIGVGEKGYANIRLTVTKDGGHSSMPDKNTSLGILAQAICRVERNPCRSKLIPAVREFLMRIGPHMRGLNRLILSNLWIFKPVFLSVFSKMNSGNALLRTTIAVTMAKGGPAPNVIPQMASAMINCRILPGETGEELIAHLKKTLTGLDVTIEPVVLDEPSKLSSVAVPQYRQIEQLAKWFCDNCIAAPYLVMAGTDARKYEVVCDQIYRFTPYMIDQSELNKIHGTNENITIQNVNRCIDFFMQLYRSEQ